MRPGRLYFGDNLEVLRGGDFPDESVDLVYLDPPFNSNRDYNVLFKEQDLSASRAQIRAFEDCWHWDQDAQETYERLIGQDSAADGVPSALAVLVEAFHKALPSRSDMVAYLVMMAPRLLELRRVLRPTGSLYLHCDPTASHYLKLLLDAIFGPTNFRNEVVWKRSSAHSGASRYGRVHDCVLYYTKSGTFTWNEVLQPLPQETADTWYNNVEETSGRRFNRADLTAPGTRSGSSGLPWRGVEPSQKGRHWAIPRFAKSIVGDLDTIDALEALDRAGRIFWPKKSGGVPMLKRYLDEAPGIPAQDVIADIQPLNNVDAERLGYPTQKPVALLERILTASSNPGDVVLDPFCGCGTTIEASQRLGREWIGIDITHLAIRVIRERLSKQFPGVQYELRGEPRDFESARALAETSPFEFQWWVVHRLGAHAIGGEPGSRYGRRGRDRGVDGLLKFRRSLDAPVQAAVLSVKGGKTINPAMVRELRGTVEREAAALGVLVTLYEPTAEMRREAASAGFLRPHGSARRFPKLQLISVAEVFAGKRIEHPGDEVEARDGAGVQPMLPLPGIRTPTPPRRKGVLITVPDKPAEAPTPLAKAAKDLPSGSHGTTRRRRGTGETR